MHSNRAIECTHRLASKSRLPQLDILLPKVTNIVQFFKVSTPGRHAVAPKRRREGTTHQTILYRQTILEQDTMVGNAQDLNNHLLVLSCHTKDQIRQRYVLVIRKGDGRPTFGRQQRGIRYVDGQVT
jgi:hypothetical protein